MDGGAWWAAVHGVAESWTRLSEFTFTFHFHALEKEMAIHSSVLAWRIPGKSFNITVIQVCAPTNNAEEAEVEQLYEDLQDLLELTSK